LAILVNLADEARRVGVEAGSIIACTELSREGEAVREAVHLMPAEAAIIALS
jgi:hypothetical protein